MSKTRVVITGLGATTPLGGDVSSTWEGLLAGRSGARRLTDEWVQNLAVQIAAPAAVEPTEVLERVKARRLDRNAQFAVVAAREAWADAGLEDSGLDKERLGIAVASGIGGLGTTLSNYDALKTNPRRVSPLAIPMLMPNSAAAYVSLEFGAKAGVHTPVSACASGNEAIALGLDQIRLGRADVVLAGGTEGPIMALTLAAFGQMMALSKRNDEPERASRPWDVDRDGFLLGEGAGVLVLESYEHAKARGAKIYAELAGAGISADGHDIAQPDPTGSGARRAMERALIEGDLTPADIFHINAH
ncbi:MAG TPA: beta-ketoacyl synthase N-terminal-like domain-containing protein, partial [Kribbella sp.]|nr:beta-ketoacyl synthase N-terminal-like domain-containing protein [Kribbella sp.]